MGDRCRRFRSVEDATHKKSPKITGTPAKTAKPLKPDSLHLQDEHRQASAIAVDAKVVEVAGDTPRERGVLRLDRLMSMAATPVVVYNGQARVERFDGALEVINESGTAMIELRPAP